jgi:hypothetical protein
MVLETRSPEMIQIYTDGSTGFTLGSGSRVTLQDPNAVRHLYLSHQTVIGDEMEMLPRGWSSRLVCELLSSFV